MGDRSLAGLFNDVQAYGLGILRGDVQHTCVALQRSVVVVSSYAVGVAEVGIPLAVVGLDEKFLCRGCFVRHFTGCTQWNHFHHVVTGRDAYHIGTSVGSIASDKFVVQLYPV